MIYLDNAAGSHPKPRIVADAMYRAMTHLGASPGRGRHALARHTADLVEQVRGRIARLIHAPDPSRVVFTAGATMSLNLALWGYLYPRGGHVLTTSMEHNAVYRPLRALAALGRIQLELVEVDRWGYIDPAALSARIRPDTSLIAVTHGSNVTGEVYHIEAIGAACRKRGIFFVVDCAQTAGVIPIDVEKMHIDILCFSGHKGLLGPQGTGGIYIRKGVPIRPFMLGGTGSKSFQLAQPEELPDCFESGTVNTHGIAGLGAGIDDICQIGMGRIHEKELALRQYFVDKMKALPEVIVYGPERGTFTGTVSINIRGMDSNRVAGILGEKDIGVRGGFHCAPLAHRSLGTDKSGAVRFSFGYGNSYREVEAAVSVIRQIVAEKH